MSLITQQKFNYRFTLLPPQQQMEHEFVHMDNLKDLYEHVLNLEPIIAKKSWRIPYYFLQGLRQVQYKWANRKFKNKSDMTKAEFDELENQAFDKVIQAFKVQTTLKIFQAVRILDQSTATKIDNKDFWQVLGDTLILNTEFENAKDIVNILTVIQDQENFNDDFYLGLMDKTEQLRFALTLPDLIDIFHFYKIQRKTYMTKNLVLQCKMYVVEDIDNLKIKEILQLMEMYSWDQDFKRFIGLHLKEKIMKNQNLSMTELMTSVSESLDLEDLRKDIIKFALNSEVFYAFSIAYYLTLLKKMQTIGYHKDFYDILKAIQIQVCLMENTLQKRTIHKVARYHISLPVLNPHFLTLIVKGSNIMQVTRKLDYQVFNLNISLINLPNISDQNLIEEYEIAFSNYLNIDNAQQFSIGQIIKLFTENEQFAKYGFYQGFGNLVFTAIISDQRSTSDVWLLSVFQKLLSFDIADKEFLSVIEKNLENNFERYCTTGLYKLVVLVTRIAPFNEKYKEILLKKVRNAYPEQIIDVKVQTQFLVSLAKLDKQKQDQFNRYLQNTMKYWYSFGFIDIYRIWFSLNYLNLKDQPQYLKYYEKLLDKTKELMQKMSHHELLFCLESFCPYLNMLPQEQDQNKYKLLEKALTKVQNLVFGSNKKSLFLLLRYSKIMPRILESFEQLGPNDPSRQLKPLIIQCQQQIDDLITIEREYNDSSDSEEEDIHRDRKGRKIIQIRQFEDHIGDANQILKKKKSMWKLNYKNDSLL